MRSAIADLVLSPEDRTRVDSVEALARSGHDGVAPLLELIGDPSWPVRRVVVAALASLGDLAVDGLEDVVLHRRQDEAGLAAAVDALVATRADVDARMMKLAREDHGAPIVCDAVQVLGRRRARAAVPLLATLSSHADDNVAVGSIEALGRIGGVDTVESLITAVEARHFFRTFPALDALARTGDARAVPSLAGLLGDPLYVHEAARALGRTGHETAVRPLVSLLSRPSLTLVRTAALALAELRERYEAQFGDTDVIRHALPRAMSGVVASTRIIESLAGVAPSELVAAARVLGWLGDDVAIEHLVDMTMHDAPVGTAAAEALRRLGRNATAQLLAAIRVGDSRRRLRLLPIIGHTSGSIDDLLMCLDDGDADVRVRASEALARLGNPVAVTSLFRLIGDRDARVAQAASAAIHSLGSLDTKRLALEQARSADVRTRRAALRIISYFGYPDGIDILVDAMRDEDEKVREAAIYGIPLVDDPKGVAALLGSAGHAVPRTRAAIVRALGQTSRIPPVVDALRTGLTDDDPWVRYYACQSLGRLAVDEACPEIVALMGDPTGQVRVAAVEALAHLADPCAAAALTRAARSDDADMQRAAFVGLGIARRPESVAILREAAEAEDAVTRLVAIGALSEFEGPDVVPTLAHAASDPDEAVRSAAIGYLSTRPGADATSALIGQLLIASSRDRVLEALSVAADERVEGVLGALESADADTAPLFVAALTRMRRPSSQAALASALMFDNAHARRAAAAALVALGTPEARDALVRAGSVDPDPDVRRICAAVVRS